MYWALIVLHVIVCTFLVLVVLLQAGKGGGIGIAFGGGGSQTVFGSSGAGNFLTRMTAICAAIFFLNSLGLAYVSSRSDSSRLQRLAEQKAAAKKTEEAAKNKVISDVEKAREALKKTEADKAQAPGTAPAPVGSPEAAKGAPASTNAPAAAAPTEKPKAAAPVEKPADKAPPK
jgi:preprotein translocase subunit SecG